MDGEEGGSSEGERDDDGDGVDNDEDNNDEDGDEEGSGCEDDNTTYDAVWFTCLATGDALACCKELVIKASRVFKESFFLKLINVLSFDGVLYVQYDLVGINSNCKLTIFSSMAGPE